MRFFSFITTGSLRPRQSLAALAAGLCLFMGTTQSAPAQERSLHIPMTTNGPKSLDPVLGSTTYENRVCSQFYETLLEYKYLKRPFELEPNLLEKMPEVSTDGLTWHFTLKPGIHFQDDPCFPGGKGREMKASDVIYSWKRLADPQYNYKAWWLLEGTIVGFDEYKEEQGARVDAKKPFDYNTPVEGLRIINDYEFEVTLVEAVQQFIWKIPMFQLSVLPREAVEYYRERFNLHPVGSGPFLLRDEADWRQGASITLYRNPNYRAVFYPSEGMPGDDEAGLLAAAGKQVPFFDRLDITFYEEQNPMWLEFRAGNTDFSTVPDPVFNEVFTRRRQTLKGEYANLGVTAFKVPLLDFIFRGFNMEDELVGGYTPEKRALRQAISLAVDFDEFNSTFYSNTCVVFDGPIPPNMDGHPEGGNGPVSYRGADIERAKELLAKAGYPNGEGLPTIEYWTSNGSQSDQMTQLLVRQLKAINVNLNPRLVPFSDLINAVDKKNAPMFSFAWGSDYPDAENNLMLFYGPNEAPKPNHFNYKNPEFDRLYEKIRTMPAGPTRTAIYETMRDMVIEDVPYLGSMARTRHYVSHPWLKNFKPTETFYTWYKYLDYDEALRVKHSKR